MSDQDFDRSEEATPHKLAEARKKGTVAKSADLNTAAIMLAMIGAIYAHGWDGIKQLARMQIVIFSGPASADWNADGIASWVGKIALSLLEVLAPLLMAVVVISILANLVQTGPIFSMKPLSPDLERINPVAGFKRILSMRTLYEAAKSIAKLIILSLIAYLTITDDLSYLASLSALDPKSYAQTLLELSGGMIGKLVLVLVVIAVIDFSYSRWEFAKRMRMSRRDIKDETKQREGDPRIRSRIRELRREMLKRSKAIQNVPSADVLITNPTHIAIALSYRHGESTAPRMVAKGAGELAHKMRKVAHRHRIPVIENRYLARTMYREVENEQFVPEKLYPQLAKIMVWVHSLRSARQTDREKV